jgi:hypothetical protein
MPYSPSRWTAGQDALAVEEDGLHHSTVAQAGRPGAGAEQAHHLAAALAGAVDEGIDALLREELSQGDASDLRRAHDGHHGDVGVAAQNVALDVLHRGPELPSDESAISGAVQHAALAHQAITGEAGGLLGDLAHGIHGIGENDDVSVGRDRERLLGDAGHDAGVGVHQVLAAHARLAGYAGRNDDDVRTGRVVPVVGAADPDIGADDGPGVRQVQGLALRETLDDIDEYDVADALLLEDLGHSAAGGARPDDGHLLAHVAPPTR